MSYQDENRINEYQNKVLNHFGKPTVDFFKDIDCTNLKDSLTNDYHFKKFFLMEDQSCELRLSKFKGYFQKSELNSHISENIEEVDFVVWLSTSDGTVYSDYQYGYQAIRKIYELQVIHKDNLKIIDRHSFEGTGDPPNSIKRRQGDDRPAYFGIRPNEAIIKYIENHIVD